MKNFSTYGAKLSWLGIPEFTPSQGWKSQLLLYPNLSNSDKTEVLAGGKIVAP